MKLRMAWLAILCLALGAIPAFAWTYDNGPVNGTTDAWTINFGFVVSDSYVAGGSAVGGFSFYAWEVPQVGPCAVPYYSICGNRDIVTSVSWTITGGENSGTLFGSGTASGANLTDKFISENQYSYDVDLITVTGLNVPQLSGTTYWLNLVNATTRASEPVYWDENSGVGCGGLNGTKQGCPSLASENETGTIPSEAFTIGCFSCGCGGCAPGGAPEPSSIMLFGSGVLGLVGILRGKLL